MSAGDLAADLAALQAMSLDEIRKVWTEPLPKLPVPVGFDPLGCVAVYSRHPGEGFFVRLELS